MMNLLTLSRRPNTFPETQDCTAGGQALAAALMAAYELEDKDKK